MIRSWCFTLAGTRVVCRLRNTLFASIIRQEVAFFDTNRTGELTSRLSSDTQVVQNAVTVSLHFLSGASFVRSLVNSFHFHKNTAKANKHTSIYTFKGRECSVYTITSNEIGEQRKIPWWRWFIKVPPNIIIYYYCHYYGWSDLSFGTITCWEN